MNREIVSRQDVVRYETEQGRTTSTTHGLKAAGETLVVPVSAAPSGANLEDKSAVTEPSLQSVQLAGGAVKSEQPARDTYTDRLLKYIPGEVIVLFTTLDSLARTADFGSLLRWGIFVFCILAGCGYSIRILKIHKRDQLVISAISFCVWVFAMGGPFALLHWYLPAFGGLLLPAYTFSIALYEA